MKTKTFIPLPTFYARMIISLDLIISSSSLSPLLSINYTLANTKTPLNQFNRPKALNSFGGNLVPDIIAALRVLDSHPDTIFTVLTGAGRFFSAGADVTSVAARTGTFKNEGEKKLSMLANFGTSKS